jgi:hypothetical protein
MENGVCVVAAARTSEEGGGGGRRWVGWMGVEVLNSGLGLAEAPGEGSNG